MSEKNRVFLVDDNQSVLQAYSELLRAEGYTTFEAGTGRDGLEQALKIRPDLVLLDVMLPDLGGLEVCRQIKGETALMDVFVVLFSGEAIDSAEQAEGLATGADDYIA